jgi:hypothetical protein
MRERMAVIFTKRLDMKGGTPFLMNIGQNFIRVWEKAEEQDGMKTKIMIVGEVGVVMGAGVLQEMEVAVEGHRVEVHQGAAARAEEALVLCRAK